MKMERTKEAPLLTTIHEPERKRLDNLEEEILLLGKELEDLKTQTFGEHSDDDAEDDPFNDGDEQ